MIMNDIFIDYSILDRLSKSKFRSSFHLKEKDYLYIKEKGIDVIEKHTRDFISKRLAPRNIFNDGRQTPYRGHPVFIGEHATATCCRGCLEKWHHISKKRELSLEEQEYIVQIIMEWIKREVRRIGN